MLFLEVEPIEPITRSWPLIHQHVSVIIYNNISSHYSPKPSNVLMALAFFFSVPLKMFISFSVVCICVCLGMQCVHVSVNALRDQKIISDPLELSCGYGQKWVTQHGFWGLSSVPLQKQHWLSNHYPSPQPLLLSLYLTLCSLNLLDIFTWNFLIFPFKIFSESPVHYFLMQNVISTFFPLYAFNKLWQVRWITIEIKKLIKDTKIM